MNTPDMNTEDMNTEDSFELFWDDSSLNATTANGWTERVAGYAAYEEPRLLTYPTPDLALFSPRDRLARVMSRRHSTRSYGPGRLSARQLGSLLSAFACGSAGGRTFPSAGGLYPLEVMCLANEVDGPNGPLDGNVLCYNPDNHTVNVVHPLPPWEEWRDTLNFPTDGRPQLIVAFVLLADRMLDKYAARGGRFALVEVGHAAQNLALRIEQEHLAGCEIGGAQDDRLLDLLGLTDTNARVALAYAVGR